MTASGFALRYAPAMSKANDVLKCLEGPASTVRPGEIPPSIDPDSATLTIGTSVETISFSVKNLLVDKVEVSLIFEFFFSLSIIDILGSKIYKGNVVYFFTFIEVILYTIITIDVKYFFK